MIKHLHLQINAEQIAVKAFLPPAIPARWGGVFLHGAGESNKERGDALCEEMARRGMHTVAFDFSGWGKSTKHTPGSIQKRVDEAHAVIDQLLIPQKLPLAVMAFSMSGQVAIELLRTIGKHIHCLALFNPAIYDRRAICVPFGAEFSTIIRQPLSWKNADISSAFEGFQGKTLLVKSEFDDVIPPEVFSLIARATPAGSLSELVIESAPHQLGSFLNEHPNAVTQIANAVMDVLGEHKSDTD